MGKNVVIGIAVGMFLVGLVFGYVAFVGFTHSGNMMVNNQQTLMQDPQFRQQMMESISLDPEAMKTWMENTQHVKEMATIMRENHDFSMQMMYTMIQDPDIRLQMLGHMTENPEAMQQMRSMVGSDMMGNNMTEWMMDSGMQGMMSQDMMMQMMHNPETREKMIQIMSKHVDEMQKLLSSKLTEDEFNTQMIELMQDHMTEMHGLMSENPETLKQMMNMTGMNTSMMDDNMMGSGMVGMQTQGQTENKQTQTTSSYVKMIDGVQVVTVIAKEFTFTPSEIHIKAGNTKFVMVNSGVGEHEMVVYEASKKEIVDKAELAEDEATIEQNILFEIEEVHPGESGEGEILNLKEGSYVIGCHIAEHYEAGMNGILIIK